MPHHQANHLVPKFGLSIRKATVLTVQKVPVLTSAYVFFLLVDDNGILASLYLKCTPKVASLRIKDTIELRAGGGWVNLQSLHRHLA